MTSVNLPNKTIQVLQFYEYFLLLQPSDVEEYTFFKTYEEVYAALDKVKTLPIKSITEKIKIKGFYKGNPKDYLRWNLDEEKEILYLVPFDNDAYSYDICTQINLQNFTWISIRYNSIYNGIEFIFTTADENIFMVIFKLESHVRFVVDEIGSHEVMEMELGTLEKIYHLLHDDTYTWYEKSMLIHLEVLGEDNDLRKCSKDRPDKVSRWIDKLKVYEWEPLEDFDDCCNCWDDIIEDWLYRKSVFLSKTIQFLLMSKKVSFTGKAIMMFIAYHSFNSSTDYNKTQGCISSYVNDLYKGTENGLNELVKLEWLEVNEYQNYEVCEWQCKHYGYHICYDEHYSLSPKFTSLVGWSFRGF